MPRANRLFLLIVLFSAPLPGARADDDGGWMFNTGRSGAAKARSASAQNASAGPSASSQSAHQLPVDEQPVPPPYGYPRKQDPLFDHGTRLPYEHQHLEKPLYKRPSYASAMPQYIKPSYAQEPIKKPMYRMPLATMPLDNKPHYYLKNPLPPSVRKPSWEFPNYLQRPNYVHQPIVKPAENWPAYDKSQIRYPKPEYLPPTYTPQEYKPPRIAPPPYIAPPK